MGFFDFLKSRKKKSSSSLSRREYLLNNGRIIDGVIVDTERNEEGDEIVHYVYSVQGVDFESYELLTDEQKKDRLKYAPGASVGIRFDHRNHGNSIVI